MRKWCINEAFEKAIKNKQPIQSPLSPMRKFDKNAVIPVEVWEDALIRAARIVDRLGIEYLPIFERVEKELNKARQQLTQMERIRRIADGDYQLLNKSLGQQSDLIEP